MVPRSRDDDAIPRATGLNLLGADPCADRGIGEPLAHLRGAAFVHPVRDRDRETGRRRGVGVLIGRDVHPRGARALDERSRLADTSAVALARRLVMRELHPYARAAADLEILLDGIQKTARLVADVARVQAALFAHDRA